MAYTLYYSPDSANLIVRMVLEELGVDYEDRKVARKRSERSNGFLRLNARGLLPVLIDHETGATLCEAGAIVLYLADKHRSLAPSTASLKERGECLKWLFMLSNTLHADLNFRFYPERYVNSVDEIPKLRLASAKRVVGHLSLIDQNLKEAATEWFLPTGLSVCDFYIGCCVRWAQIYPVGDVALSSHTVQSMVALAQLLKRIEDRPSVTTALNKEGIAGRAFIEPLTHLPARSPDTIGSVMP